MNTLQHSIEHRQTNVLDIEMTIQEFIDLYSHNSDPIFELARVATEYYVRENLGRMTARELVTYLSQHGDLYEYHIRSLFDIDD